MPLRYAPQGGWIFIDAAIEPLSGAYSIGFESCIPFGFICFETGRLAFCHLDHPNRLDMLADAMIWVCKQDRNNLQHLVFFMDPSTWTGAKKQLVITAIRMKIGGNPNMQPLGRGQAAGLALDGRPLRTPARVPLAVPTRSLAEAIAGCVRHGIGGGFFGARVTPGKKRLQRVA